MKLTEFWIDRSKSQEFETVKAKINNKTEQTSDRVIMHFSNVLLDIHQKINAKGTKVMRDE